MKRSIIILSALITFFIFASTSCEKPESFTSIKKIESQIYNEIKVYRENSDITGYFVHQPIMVMEAQLFSAKMAYAAKDVDTTGIAVHWDMIHKIGGTDDLTLVQSTASSSTAAEIVNFWKANPEIDSLLLLDYSQCGAGVEINNGIAYVTVLMMLIE